MSVARRRLLLVAISILFLAGGGAIWAMRGSLASASRDTSGGALSDSDLRKVQAIARQFPKKKVRVVGVFVNSGSPQEVRKLLGVYDLAYDVWVHQDPSIGDLLSSHLVPAYFLLDGRGEIREKIVEFKTREEMMPRIGAFLEEEERPNRPLANG